MPRTIVVLDDHALFAMGVEMMIGTLAEPFVCIARADADIAVQEVESGQLAAALFIVDYFIPGSYAPDLVRRLRGASPKSTVLVVSASHNPSDQKNALEAGAMAYVNKSERPEHILAAIQSALRGEEIQQGSSTDVLAQFDLTQRQLDIVVLVSKGLTNKEIAQMLDLSPETVKTHLSNVFRKLGVAGRVEAIDQLRGMGLA
ncbi:Response regulator receiver domain-containing protein [Cognatiyoonia koreensis]|uniref:Response regulator receiver domain-containing protein n=1 Tax=Cognatiyoonia koreensis TaxID=364200 RepID=A0A1I0RNA2_9RHOB|nr:response regulator transcription factor [Cognatiyoonia koreensis]SEW42690.1 Response regulator receiver domain-containing protein [Cognatiyoonia koreensis]